MASVNAITFDQASYRSGELMTATVNFIPDTPSTVSASYTVTAQVHDQAGNAVGAPMSGDYAVISAQPGDSCALSDSGGHAWAAGEETVEADGSLSQPFTATA